MGLSEMALLAGHMASRFGRALSNGQASVLWGPHAWEYRDNCLMSDLHRQQPA